MRPLRNLFFEQYKNFRILLRNISSLLLLVVGPLFLILLVGFAYSGETLHDINIGITSSNFDVLEPALQNFSTYGVVREYPEAIDCIGDLALEKMHVCLVFSDDFGQADSSGSGLVTGTITFYFDNSRKPVSTKVVESISSFFGVEAEKVSIDSAKTILSEIKDFVGYVEDKNEDIYLLINESWSIRDSLMERHARLVELREDFMPVYEDIKLVQTQLDNLSRRLDESYYEYNESRSEVYLELALLRMRIRLLDDEMRRAGVGYASGMYGIDDIYVYEQDGLLHLSENMTWLSEMNLSYRRLEELNYTIDPEGAAINISGWGEAGGSINLTLEESYLRLRVFEIGALGALDGLEDSLGNFSDTSDDYYFYLKRQKSNFDEAVVLVDELKLMLDADIAATEEYISKIDMGIFRMEQLQAELNSSVKVFSRLDPEMAEELINPFLQEYEPLLPKISNIKQAYPGMIAIIVIFISILFANIVTLSEINSKAFFRNLLSPVSRLTFMFGLVITTLIIVLLQVIVLLMVGQFSFGIDVLLGLGSLSIVIIMLSLIFLMLGMVIAILIRSEQSSVLTTTFAALGFFLFSNSITPIEIMPKLASIAASLNPYVIATTAFRKVIIFGLGPEMLLPELLVLGAYLAGGLIVLIAVSHIKLKN